MNQISFKYIFQQFFEFFMCALITFTPFSNSFQIYPPLPHPLNCVSLKKKKSSSICESPNILGHVTFYWSMVNLTAATFLGKTEFSSSGSQLLIANSCSGRVGVPSLHAGIQSGLDLHGSFESCQTTVSSFVNLNEFNIKLTFIPIY